MQVESLISFAYTFIYRRCLRMYLHVVLPVVNLLLTYSMEKVVQLFGLVRTLAYRFAKLLGIICTRVKISILFKLLHYTFSFSLNKNVDCMREEIQLN